MQQIAEKQYESTIWDNIREAIEHTETLFSFGECVFCVARSFIMYILSVEELKEHVSVVKSPFHVSKHTVWVK